MPSTSKYRNKKASKHSLLFGEDSLNILQNVERAVSCLEHAVMSVRMNVDTISDIDYDMN